MPTDREESLAYFHAEIQGLHERIQRATDLTPEDKFNLSLKDALDNVRVCMDDAREERLADDAFYRRQAEPLVRGLSHINAAE